MLRGLKKTHEEKKICTKTYGKEAQRPLTHDCSHVQSVESKISSNDGERASNDWLDSRAGIYRSIYQPPRPRSIS
ncbi:hypothetical protein Tco_1319467 [Tanacetum coccineum]